MALGARNIWEWRPPKAPSRVLLSCHRCCCCRSPWATRAGSPRLGIPDRSRTAPRPKPKCTKKRPRTRLFVKQIPSSKVRRSWRKTGFHAAVRSPESGVRTGPESGLVRSPGSGVRTPGSRLVRSPDSGVRPAGVW
eukprot:scaffold77305_cov56-Phaeocystis_antarctica.AAC.1